MKIDFLGRYQDVAKLLNSPARAPEGAQPANVFGKLLADIAPDRPKIAEKPVEKPANQTPPPLPPRDDNGPMASFKFAEPTLVTPRLEPLPLSQSEIKVDSTPKISVKTPTIKDARRVVPSDRLVDLQKNDRMAEVKRLVVDAGGKFGIDPALGMAVVQAESSFDPNAISTDGFRSKGLFQLLDTTGQHIMEKHGKTENYDPFNPNQNVELGVSYLRHLHEIFAQQSELPNNTRTEAAANSSSLEKLAVAAFNAGEGRVAAAQERAKANGFNPTEYSQVAAYLPETTREYVERVMKLREGFVGTF